MQRKGLSDRQNSVIDSIDNDDARYILCSGPVRAGKTASAIIAFLCWATKNFSNHSFLLASYTLGQIRETVIPEIQNFADFLKSTDPPGIECKPRLGLKRVYFGSNTFLIYEGQDSQSEGKIRGLTLAGAYLDEVTYLPKDFFDQVANRCSINGAKIFMSCNPQGPSHWVKRNFIDNAEQNNALYFPFEIKDNPSNPKTFVKSLYSRPEGFSKDRDVYGKWVEATGPVYTEYTVDSPTDKAKGKANRYEIAVDEGMSSVTTALLIGIYDNNVYIEDEWRYDARKGQKMAFSDMAHAIKDKFGGYYPKRIIIDRHADGVRQELNKIMDCRIEDDANDPYDVIPGINVTRHWLSSGYMRISKQCSHLLTEIENYIWDPKAAERGIDKPKKENDHAMDAMRYFAYTASQSKQKKVRYNRQ